jgi:hypothetical protein
MFSSGCNRGSYSQEICKGCGTSSRQCGVTDEKTSRGHIRMVAFCNHWPPLDANTGGTGDRGWPWVAGRLAFTFWLSEHPLSARRCYANLQIVGGNDMKPPDDKMPEEMRNLIMEQMPWLKDPNNTIPTVDPADIKAL